MQKIPAQNIMWDTVEMTVLHIVQNIHSGYNYDVTCKLRITQLHSLFDCQ